MSQNVIPSIITETLIDSQRSSLEAKTLLHFFENFIVKFKLH